MNTTGKEESSMPELLEHKGVVYRKVENIAFCSGCALCNIFVPRLVEDHKLCISLVEHIYPGAFTQSQHICRGMTGYVVDTQATREDVQAAQVVWRMTNEF